jgi:hypothetical protein
LPVAVQKPVPVHAVPSHPVKVPANRPWHLPPASWPAAGTATLVVPASAPAAVSAATSGKTSAALLAAARTAAMALPSAGSSRAGTLPIWVGPGIAGASTSAPSAAVTGQAGSVRVVMAPREAAARVGVSGVVFTVAQSSSVAGARPVHVSLDYSSFAYADGGDFAARLRLVELPYLAIPVRE